MGKIQIRDLRPEEIEVKVKSVTENSALLLLYKTARVDMDILDETFGPENWSCDYKEIKGNLYCGITVNINGEKVTKWDCGVESREDGEGNEKKGEASDSFKRAGFKWGIGRELYTAPEIRIKPPNVKIMVEELKNGKKRFYTFDKFAVKSITIKNKRITALSIVNKRTGKVVFAYSEGEPLKKPDPEVQALCHDCNKVIKSIKTNKGEYSAEHIVKSSKEKFGVVLCVDCAKRRINAAKES